jgi:hypothetical protein
MDFGKFGSLGGFGSMPGLGGSKGGSSNFLIWILLAVVIFGFGKGRSIIGPNIFQAGAVPPEPSQSRKRGKGPIPPPPPPPGPLGGLGAFGKGPIGGMLGGNLLFIVIVIVLLVMCKEKKVADNPNTYVDVDEVMDEQL